MTLKGRFGFIYTMRNNKGKLRLHYKSYMLATKSQWIKWWNIPSYLLFGSGLDNTKKFRRL